MESSSILGEEGRGEKQTRTSNRGWHCVPRSQCRPSSVRLVCYLIRQPALPVDLFSWGDSASLWGLPAPKTQVQIQTHPHLQGTPGHEAAETSPCWSQSLLNFPRGLCCLLCAPHGRSVFWGSGGGVVVCVLLPAAHSVAAPLTSEGGGLPRWCSRSLPPGVHTLGGFPLHS